LAGWLALFGSSCEVSGISRDRSVAVIVNDLEVPVRLRLCSSNDCRGGFHPPDATLSPREDWQVNVSSVGVPAVYLAETAGETRRLGCLPLVSPKLRPAVTVYVSEHLACRAEIDEEEFWPRRWEDVPPS
jgi:hypothetical protein